MNVSRAQAATSSFLFCRISDPWFDQVPHIRPLAFRIHTSLSYSYIILLWLHHQSPQPPSCIKTFIFITLGHYIRLESKSHTHTTWLQVSSFKPLVFCFYKAVLMWVAWKRNQSKRPNLNPIYQLLSNIVEHRNEGKNFYINLYIIIGTLLRYITAIHYLQVNSYTILFTQLPLTIL